MPLQSKAEPPEARPLGADLFRAAMRQVASPVAIVTSASDGIRNGLTATAICSVTAEPPTILVCVNRNARAEALIAASGFFAVNFLSEDHHEVARLFSTPTLEPEDRFADPDWTTLVSGMPVLESAVAIFDCRVADRVTRGTHNLYFGEVLGAASLDQSALIYRDGLFRKLAQPA